MANVIGYGDQMVKLEAYGDQLVGPVPLPSSPGDLESIYNALSAKGITPASESLSDILASINTIVVPSGKYTYPSGSTGGDVDVTNYAQVNASNVYAKGKADGSSFSSQTVTFTVPASSNRWLTLTAATSFGTKIVGITSYSNNSQPWNCVMSIGFSGKTISCVVDACEHSYSWTFTVTAIGY